jgi:hypothetical protein
LSRWYGFYYSAYSICIRKKEDTKYLLSYDVGTTGIKTCVFAAGGYLERVASALANLYTVSPGWRRIRAGSRRMVEYNDHHK